MRGGKDGEKGIGKEEVVGCVEHLGMEKEGDSEEGVVYEDNADCGEGVEGYPEGEEDAVGSRWSFGKGRGGDGDRESVVRGGGKRRKVVIFFFFFFRYHVGGREAVCRQGGVLVVVIVVCIKVFSGFGVARSILFGVDFGRKGCERCLAVIIVAHLF